jgi:hypothetical protein
MTWKKPTPEELAADWIASRKSDANDDTSGHLAQFLLVDFPQEEPELTWEAVRLVMRAFPDSDYYAQELTDAQKVCGELAAGPVEDLLSFHGNRFIDRFEEEARSDRRMAWILGGAWQLQMSDDIWNRVQLAADRSYWARRES